ncbi:MAG: hydantoinase/oxoprolinase family protein [Gammaproteobacteria bacterium]|nr:hydantoinase/oxoprolinase family protein [Gammaproteobacteria bacterium]
MLLLGIDTGGTFTDFVLLDAADLRIHKVLSTPEAPEQAILQGIAELGLQEAVSEGRVRIVHGSTVATNAALEGKGVRTAFVTNRGFADLLTIGRQTRRELYNLQPPLPLPPVPADLCFETGGRVDAQGQTLEPLTDADIAHLLEQLRAANVEAVAVCLLFSFLDPAAEQRLLAALSPHWLTSISSAVLPESGEYERGIATWLNASLGPKVKQYLAQLRDGVAPSPLAIMQSTGGTLDTDQAGERAVNLLLSGPAGGMAAARFIAGQLESSRLLTFDMGGTSTDVALIDGDIRLTNEGRIGPWPVAVPQVDMHTIGAGGGSIAWIDAGGLLQVGPQSAGAAPGPACYGRGGNLPTVTDANALLGRLRPDYFLGGRMTLDLDAARRALQPLADQLELSLTDAAQGILSIANEHMARALRVISVQRGHDVRRFRLCSFGGAGGLHVCALAAALGMDKALVPVHGGVLSAFGMVVAPAERQASRALGGLLRTRSQAQIQSILQTLGQEAVTALQQSTTPAGHSTLKPSLDLRYQGQRYYLNIPWQGDLQQAEDDFHTAHAARFGHRLPMAVEVVNARVQVQVMGGRIELPEWPVRTPATPRDQCLLAGFSAPVPLYWRDDLACGQVVAGPALVVETVSTLLIEADWQATPDRHGHLLLDRSGA